MRVTIAVDSDTLGDVTVTRENRLGTLGGTEDIKTLDDLLTNAIGQVVRAYGLDVEEASA